ncbi:hypothetical protein DF281_05830 [Kurthia zopfii]|nr:hypothetical protein DF281_05830 [Kurthia zopfii]
MRSTAGATTRVEGELEKEHLGVTPATGAKREGARKDERKSREEKPEGATTRVEGELEKKSARGYSCDRSEAGGSTEGERKSREEKPAGATTGVEEELEKKRTGLLLRPERSGREHGRWKRNLRRKTRRSNH